LEPAPDFLGRSVGSYDTRVDACGDMTDATVERRDRR
jgi:hypothetical protein